MAKPAGITRVLIDHFFRRFFDSDIVQVEGETLTTVVRAIAIVAVPGLMASFFMQNQYPRRSVWGTIEDQYSFVLFSFLVMGIVTIFEWEMLFPDRWDFLVLSPLPVKPLQMLGAKATALIAFLALFLVSSNFFGTLILPLVTKRYFFRQVYAHGVAVSLAGLFAALLFLALGGLLLCVLGARRFRLISPLMQMVSVTALLLLFVHYARYGDAMQDLLENPHGMARWTPPFWFLGVYEQLLHGDGAPAFAPVMAKYAFRGTLIAAAIVVLTYPIAWARMRRMAIEGSSQKRRPQSRWLAWLLDRITHSPGVRAVFVFIGQTITRNNRYQIYLAMYAGTGLALAISCAVSIRTSGYASAFGLSNKGLHAMMPLLLFWLIAGLRATFAFPLDLAAGWIFRITGASISAAATAARRWMQVCGAGVAISILAVLAAAGWGLRDLLVQLICGLCLCSFLVDAFFGMYKSVPLNQPRLPGKTSLPLMLTLYLGIFPLFILEVIAAEMRWERHPAKLLIPIAGAAVLHLMMKRLRSGPDEVAEEMEGYEGEFQLLGLS
jgi:hypothetical protein